MTGLAHRGWELADYSRHIVHPLREAGYWSALVGEQHLSESPDVLGYDHVVDIGTTRVASITPATLELLRAKPPEPFFLSIGFFETHREFFEPSSVRDALYGAPPNQLPDTPATRAHMAAFKASARSLDQGVGAVLHGLDEAGLADDTLVVLTTDHGLPFPGAKATLSDQGLGVLLIIRGPGGFHGGHVTDGLTSHVDLYPTLLELAGVPVPDETHGHSLLPLARRDLSQVRQELFAELTYHAAYDPQRAIRTRRNKLVRHFGDRLEPVLPNVDDSPSKSLLISAGWGNHRRPRVELYDLIMDPTEMRNLAEVDEFAQLRHELDGRLNEWMVTTRDPLLQGPVPAPAGAFVNDPAGVSASEPPLLAVDRPAAPGPRPRSGLVGREP